jgi:next-to-BRCA1 protein 1
MRYMGDRRPETIPTETKSTSTETTPVQQTNAATQVQTMAEIKPTEEKVPIVKAEEPKSIPNSPASSSNSTPSSVLNAHFVRDSIPDGKVFQPGTVFTQVWFMHNPGPYAWPAGCSIRFVGGDNMLNVDNERPASITDIADATESNVVGRQVEIGEQIAFKIVLKAPMREGKHISYWRMKSADGTPFGHRLWCDIEVKKPAEAKAPSPAPAVFNTPFDASQQAQLQRMQAMRQQQMQMMKNQQMVMQAQMRKQQEQAQAQAAANGANISARIAAMREQQAKRREQMMAQFNAQRDQLQAQGIKREDMPSWPQHANPAIGSSTEVSEEEKARKEAARARVEHVKAKILRAREEKAKAFEAFKENAAKEKEVADKKSAEENEKVNKIIEEVKNSEDESKAETEDVETSQMVFPKLEKESPASSTYESAPSTSSKGKAAYVENEEGEIEHSATPAPVPVPEVTSPIDELDDDFDELDDIEVLSANGDESEDDGFLTDEEYDILDASDQETVASK